MLNPHFEAYNALGTTLQRIDALIEGTAMIRENCTDLHQETYLLAMTQEQVKEAERLMKAMNEEYRKLVKK